MGWRRILVMLPLVAACGFDGNGASDDAGDDGPGNIDAPQGDIDAPVTGSDAPLPDIDARVDARVDAAVDAEPEACPSSYTVTVPGSRSRYRVVTSIARWLQAEMSCEADGAASHLVVLDDVAERNGVDALINGSFWVGISDRVTEDTFLLVTGGAPGFVTWANNQPDNFFNEDCVHVFESGELNDADCASTFLAYVCECDGIPADPTTYTP